MLLTQRSIIDGMPAFRNIQDAWQVFFPFLFLVSHVQQGCYPMCHLRLKKNGALCLLHSIPYGCHVLPDQIRRKKKPKVASHLKTKFGFARNPVLTWEGVMTNKHKYDGQLWVALEGECVSFNLQLWPLQGVLTSFCPVFKSIKHQPVYFWNINQRPGVFYLIPCHSSAHVECKQLCFWKVSISYLVWWQM